MLEHLVYLHFSRNPDDPGSGATFERLAALSSTRDQIGARSVRTGLRLAQIAGLVFLTRSRSDARLRIYEPADALLAIIGKFAELAFEILDQLAPKLQLGAHIRSEPDFLHLLYKRTARFYLHDNKRLPFEADPMTSLLRLEGGRAILTTVIDCYWRRLPLPTSLQFARRFHVSPSQIRAILKSAEAHGFIRTAARGVLLDADPLAEAYLDAQSRYLAYAMGVGMGLDGTALASEDATT
ncbi:MAG: hypothetical protein KGM15_14020 [Pseudomonadota bacterium]|nr:hypothetical protein [Pseudomonadota bacterium]